MCTCSAQAEATKSMNYCLTSLYHNCVFIETEEAALTVQAGLHFLQCYSRPAKLSHARKLKRFPLYPKLHYLHHTFLDLIAAKDRKHCSYKQARTQMARFFPMWIVRAFGVLGCCVSCYRLTRCPNTSRSQLQQIHYFNVEPCTNSETHVLRGHVLRIQRTLTFHGRELSA